MRIVVLGGAGKMGCIAVQTLAGDERVKEVVLADLNLDQAKIVAEYILLNILKVQKLKSRRWMLTTTRDFSKHLTAPVPV